METTRELSYGEKAVGLSFNPSGSGEVNKVKELYAQIIDICNDIIVANEATGATVPEQTRLFKIAITEAQGAQMWAVKALTWQGNVDPAVK